MTSDSSVAGGGTPPARLTRDDLHRIAGDAAREQSPPLDVVGVTGGADTSYAEVLFTGAASHRPHPLLIGVFRDSTEQALRNDLRDKLDERSPDR